jgi:hypothetical protein
MPGSRKTAALIGEGVDGDDAPPTMVNGDGGSGTIAVG